MKRRFNENYNKLSKFVYYLLFDIHELIEESLHGVLNGKEDEIRRGM
jgi:hypothetical protein